MPPPERSRIPRVHVIAKAGRKFLSLRHRDPVTGREYLRSARTNDTREAERAAARWERELIERQELGAIATTWAEFRVRYAAEVLLPLAEKTGTKATTALASFERFARPARVVDATPERISAWVASLRTEQAGSAHSPRPPGKREDSTVAGYVAHIRSALRWAAEVGMIHEAPRVPRIRMGKRKTGMRGRPLTDAEIERLIATVPTVVPRHPAPWQRLVRGLHLSGLRLSEALPLTWDGKTGIRVDLSGRRPMLLIHVEDEKARTDRMLPITPDFAAFLTATPAADRAGLVFPLPKEKQRGGELWSVSRVSERLTLIGETAKIVVNDRTGKTASAHDLRRTFGFRWSRLVMPPVLMELMRHANIQTTMQFYVGINAESTADTIWSAWQEQRQEGDSQGDTTPESDQATIGNRKTRNDL